MWQPKCTWYCRVCSVNMDAWYYRNCVACDIMEWHKGDVMTFWIRSPVTYTCVVHSTWLSRTMWWTHAPTFNKWQKKKKKNKTLHMLIHGVMWGRGLTSLVVCIYDKFYDIRERNLIIKSEIWTTNIRSLGFLDIREYVTLWRLILWSLGCTRNMGQLWQMQHVCPKMQLGWIGISIDKTIIH